MANRHRLFIKSAQLIAFVMACGTTAIAAPMVTGSVAFDSATGIYTYTYSVDNTAGPGNITGFNLQINSLPYSQFSPLSFEAPAGWTFSVGGVAGGSCSEFSECGGFWSWSTLNPAPNGLPPGQILGGFSFQTNVAPSTSTGNNYFLFYPYFPDFSAFGNVVAPDYMVAPPSPPPPLIPEPSAIVLVPLGLLGLLATRLCRPRVRSRQP